MTRFKWFVRFDSLIPLVTRYTKMLPESTTSHTANNISLFVLFFIKSDKMEVEHISQFIEHQSWAKDSLESLDFLGSG